MPFWLESVSVISLIAAGIAAVIVALDIVGGRWQRMWIMDIVWPLTALYSGPIGLWAYFSFGRLSSKKAAMEAKQAGREPPARTKPFWQKTAIGSTHCGSGCTLGDIVAESFTIAVPLTLLGHRMFGSWVLDYAAAFLFGIAFQYFTIKPMKNLSPGKGLVAALKADTLSLTAWQVGMYGWMAIATFAIFGRELEKTTPVFWFVMQVAMLAGFATSFPVNWWLLRKGIKEEM
jgi:hypothetical protein